jgi:LPXTG-site transpeptidase (sortase) family protein
VVAIVGVTACLIALSGGLWAAGRSPAAPGTQAHRSMSSPASVPAAAATGPPAGPWWQPLPMAHTSFVPVRLVIEKLRVSAPIEVRSTDTNNVMEAPDRPADVAWYRFTARPGSGSNAVFAGHRDFAKVGPAVFWNLGDLRPGDSIDVVSPQQTEIRYRVGQVWSYPVDAMPMSKVLAVDVGDEVTLITCAGRYSRDTGYDHRLVVRAQRVL